MRKTSSLGVLALALLLPLSACTANEQTPPAESSKSVTLKIARGDLPIEQALAEVYKNALEAEGYKAEINKSGDNPYQQVRNGQADVAVDQAGMAIGMAKDTAEIIGEDKVLSVDDLKNLRSEINDSSDEFEALDLSSADAGKSLVMSNAEAEIHEIDSLSSLASACSKITIVTDDTQTAKLKTGLKEQDCTQPKISVVKTADLVHQLRTSTDRAVALPADNAMISDEGFKSISDSAKFFDAAPYMLLANNNVDDKARGELNKITGKLSQQTLVDLNRMVNDFGAMTPKQAATRWEWIIE